MTGNIYKLLQKLWLTGLDISSAAVKMAPAPLIILILCMKWCYTNMA